MSKNRLTKRQASKRLYEARTKLLNVYTNCVTLTTAQQNKILKMQQELDKMCLQLLDRR